MIEGSKSNGEMQIFEKYKKLEIHVVPLQPSFTLFFKT